MERYGFVFRTGKNEEKNEKVEKEKEKEGER